MARAGLAALLLATLAACGGATPEAAMPPPTAPLLVSVSISVATLQGGQGAIGTVVLGAPALSPGAEVALGSDRGSVSVPGSIIVPTGSASATFAMTTSVVQVEERATITAQLGAVRQLATVTITPSPPTPPPPTLVSVEVSPTTVEGGGRATGTVVLSGPAPSPGVDVVLQSSRAGVTVPGSVRVPAGAGSATFELTTSVVEVEGLAGIIGALDGVTRVAFLTLTPPPCALRTPGAQWLAFASRRAGTLDIFAMRDDGTCLAQVTSGAGDERFVAWSPAGTLAYMSFRSGRMQVYVRDFTTGAESLLDVGDLTATSPAFSPDGRFVAFEGYAPGVTAVSDVYVVPAAGGTPVKVTTSQRYNAGPAWSPDGSTLYFVSNRVGGYNVWKVQVAGGAESMIPGTGGILGQPVVTPDGSGIAYTISAPGAAFTKVVIQTLSTGEIRTVTSQVDGEPTFDRTGARMVVTSQRGGNADLLLLDTATGNVVRQLTSDPGVDGAAVYAPFP